MQFQVLILFCFPLWQEEEKRGQPNYEHLEEDLHVLITVEDTQERASIRLDKAVDEIKILMKPVVQSLNCFLSYTIQYTYLFKLFSWLI